jgi:hypothetical protein
MKELTLTWKIPDSAYINGLQRALAPLCKAKVRRR